MIKSTSSIDTDKVLLTISNTLEEVTSGLNPELLSTKEKQSLLKDLDALELYALKCKIEVESDIFFLEKPAASIRNFLIELLSRLPDHLAPGTLSELVKFATEQCLRRTILPAKREKMKQVA